MHKSHHSTYGSVIAPLNNAVPYYFSFVMRHEYSRSRMRVTFTDPRGNSAESSGKVVPLCEFIQWCRQKSCQNVNCELVRRWEWSRDNFEVLSCHLPGGMKRERDRPVTTLVFGPRFEAGSYRIQTEANSLGWNLCLSTRSWNCIQGVAVTFNAFCNAQNMVECGCFTLQPPYNRWRIQGHKLNVTFGGCLQSQYTWDDMANCSWMVCAVSY